MASSGESTGLNALLGQLAFRVDGTGYCWEDVVLAAWAWGDWAALEDEVCQGIACVRHALATDALPSDEDVLAAANAFRAAANLRTVQQMEAWLQGRGLTVANWFKYIKRSMLRERWLAQLPQLTARYPASAKRSRRALKIIGICSGHLSRFAMKLAGRAAVHATLAAETLPGHAGHLPIDLGNLNLQSLADICPRLVAESSRQKLLALARVEASWLQFCQQRLTAQAIAAQVVAHRTHWIRIDGQSVAFADEAAAQEAACCVREDGEALAAVAGRIQAPVRPERFYLEALEPSLSQRFLAARSGDLLGPHRSAGEFRLFQVAAKVLPAAGDADIRRRAEAIILQKAVDQEVAQRVQWEICW